MKTENNLMKAVAEKLGKRKPVLKRKDNPSVVIAIGAPKPAPSKMGSEDEASPADAAEDEAEYGAEGGMCECPECGHKFNAGEHMAESEDDSEMESEDESEDED